MRGIVRKFNMHQNDVLKCRICTYNGPTIGGTYNIFNVFIYLFSLFDVFLNKTNKLNNRLRNIACNSCKLVSFMSTFFEMFV